jgi:bacterioferritin-associated ferredoxin
MRPFWFGFAASLLALGAGTSLAQTDAPGESQSFCILCHGESDIWEGPQRHLFVPEDYLKDDIHWNLGFRCHDCHGGDPANSENEVAHSPENGFRSLKDRANVPEFCGHCHSNIETMIRFSPSPRTNQLAEYWTSGHGKKLKENHDLQVATCISCHGGHGMRAADDPQSPVYPTNVAKTCGKCHSDAELMKERTFHGKPFSLDQLEKWTTSVHGQKLLGDGDLSAATCNDCHGNHGTVVPDVTAVANACGSCHVRVAELFNGTKMKHGLEKAALPGCVACHGHHDIRHPTDDMLGIGDGGDCGDCHRDGKFGATIAGREAAVRMHDGLEDLKRQIDAARLKIRQAEILGMEIHGPQFDLRQAQESLTAARTLVHGFALEPMQAALDEGMKTAGSVDAAAQRALDEHTDRRVWLAVSLLPIFAAVVLLLRYIRALPPAPSMISRETSASGT